MIYMWVVIGTGWNNYFEKHWQTKFMGQYKTTVVWSSRNYVRQVVLLSFQISITTCLHIADFRGVFFLFICNNHHNQPTSLAIIPSRYSMCQYAQTMTQIIQLLRSSNSWNFPHDYIVLNNNLQGKIRPAKSASFKQPFSTTQ